MFARRIRAPLPYAICPPTLVRQISSFRRNCFASRVRRSKPADARVQTVHRRYARSLSQKICRLSISNSQKMFRFHNTADRDFHHAKIMTKLAAKIIACFILSAVLICFARNAASFRAPVRVRQNPDALIGVWGSENIFGSAVRWWRAGRWTRPNRSGRARIGGFDVPVRRDNDAIAFSLENNAGEFRGHVSSDEKSLYRRLIQPAGVTQQQSLRHSRSFCAIQARDKDGARSLRWTTTFPSTSPFSARKMVRYWRSFAIPEFNIFRRRSISGVEIDGTKSHAQEHSKSQRQSFEGTYDPKSDRLSLPALDSRPPVQFTRRSGSNATGFVPRDPGAGTYVYRTPEATDDGWATASLADVDLAPGFITALISKIISANFAGQPPSTSTVFSSHVTAN